MGAIALIQFPQGVLTFQVRLFRAALEELRERSPQRYRRLTWATLAYAVAFVVLLVIVRDMWWLWVAITFLGYNGASGYLVRRYQRSLRRAADEFATPAEPALELAPTAPTEVMAPQ